MSTPIQVPQTPCPTPCQALLQSKSSFVPSILCLVFWKWKNIRWPWFSVNTAFHSSETGHIQCTRAHNLSLIRLSSDRRFSSYISFYFIYLPRHLSTRLPCSPTSCNRNLFPSNQSALYINPFDLQYKNASGANFDSNFDSQCQRQFISKLSSLPCFVAGGAVYSPALTDFTFMIKVQ